MLNHLHLVCLIALTPLGTTAAEQSPLKALFLTGGGYHDYQRLVPHLTSNLSQSVAVTFDVKFELDALKDPAFAEKYDVIVYNLCFDEADGALLDNAINATRQGKPAVMIHCAVHAFRRSIRVREWENCCGMRSKVHDPYQPFTTRKLDTNHAVLKRWPDEWKTLGDELYQTIEFLPGSYPLLKAKSPKDGREHIVSWTSTCGKGRVFATTLGHDFKTAADPHYLRLLADGLLWACQKLDSDGRAPPGYRK